MFWIINIFFGAILLDIAYSNLNVDRYTETTVMFSKVADFLLGIGTATILVALGAIVFSWKFKIARNLFIIGFLIIIFEFLTPVFFSQFFQSTQVAQELSIGYWVRLIISGLASILASIELHNFYHQRKINYLKEI